MNTISRQFAAAALIAAISSVALAEMMDRPAGIRIGERMTLRPYLGFSATFDSDVEGRSEGSEDVVWTINPGLNLEYRAETWSLLANVFYQYNSYAKDRADKNPSYHAWGEDLTYKWANSLPGEKGWTLMLSEKVQLINELEDVTDSVGHTYGNDRREVKVAGAIQRRVTNNFHVDLNGNYYWLDYDNDNTQDSDYGLYGWHRWGVGLESGYAFSRWTDLLIAGSVQDYGHENRDNNYYDEHSEYRMSSGAKGWTAQVGIGSYATERITYRLLCGWSTYEYDRGGEASDGFSYTVSAHWRITETWRTMLLGTSYYQPSEREFGSSQRVDTLSWGLAHSMIQGKLQSMVDLGYRREGREYAAVESYDYDLNIFTARLGLTYILNRYLQFYGNIEYRKSMCEGSGSSRGAHYDYDRVRGTIGLRLTY